MSERDRAEMLISSIIDWAIGMDVCGIIGEFEGDSGISIDEALKILYSST